LNDVPLGHYTIIAAKGSLQFSQEVEHRAALTPVDAVLTPTGTITGKVQTVLDAVTVPVSGAMVYLEGNSYVAFTGADGVFTMTNVPTNRSFVLKVMPGANGYPTSTPAVTALAGQTVNAGTIALALPVEQSGSITGKVVMEAVAAPDQMLAGTIVLLDGPEKYFALTDDNGNYGFIVKTAGAYSVNAVHPEFIVTPARHDINVALGATPTVAPDFTLSARPISGVPEPTWLVSGNVVDLNNVAVDGVRLTLSNIDDPAFMPITVVTGTYGTFSFRVPAGSYALTCGTDYNFEPFANYTAVEVVAADQNLGNIAVKSTVEPLFVVDGFISKSSFAYADNDEAGVVVTISGPATFQPQSAVSAVNGYFSFKVPAGTYSFVAGGFYALADPTIYTDFVVTADQTFSQVVVQPNSKVGAIIQGVISPVNLPSSYRVKLEGVNLTDYETTQPGTGFYSFDDVPAGDYKVVVLPDMNGHYVESALISVIPGGVNTVDLTAANVAPVISNAVFPDFVNNPNRLEVTGSNFGSSPSSFVDNKAVSRYSGFTATDISDQLDLVAVMPGTDHMLVMQTSWLRPGTSDVYTLKSAPFYFNRTPLPPFDIAVSDVLDTSARIIWKNAPGVGRVEVNITPALAGFPMQVDGNFINLQGLTSATAYTVQVRSIFDGLQSNLVSAPAFTTKTSGINDMSVMSLAGIPASAMLAGFEVYGSNIFVAHVDAVDLVLNSYPLAGGAPVSNSFGIYGGYPELTSMAVSADGVYLTYIDTQQDPRYAFIDHNLTAGSFVTKSLFADLGLIGASGAKFTVHDGRVFLAVTTSNDGFGTVSFFEMSDINTPTQLGTTVNLSGSVYGNMAMLCADETTGRLFTGILTGVYPSPSVLEVNAYNLNDLTPIGAVGQAEMPGSGFSLFDFKFANGKIYFQALGDGSGTNYRSMDAATGYVAYVSTGQYTEKIALDAKGRIWSAEASVSNSFYVQYSPEGQALRNIKVGQLPSGGCDYMKLGADQTFYMPYFESSSAVNMSVYKYNSSF